MGFVDLGLPFRLIARNVEYRVDRIGNGRLDDRMCQAVTTAAPPVSPAGWLILLTTQPLVDEMKAVAGTRVLMELGCAAPVC